MTGFKSAQLKDIVVSAGEVRTPGQLKLEVGALSESVQVTAEVSQIQLATGEKAGLITSSQFQNLAVKGRDMFAFLATIPGVVDNGSQARETAGPDSMRGTFINGARENQKNFAVDGITDPVLLLGELQQCLGVVPRDSWLAHYLDASSVPNDAR